MSKLVLVTICLAVWLSGCTSSVEYNDHQGRNTFAVKTGGVGISAEDSVRLQSAIIHAEIAQTCLRKLSNSPANEGNVSWENLPAIDPEEDTGLDAGLADNSQLLAFCVEWVKNLKGLDPPSNPHAPANAHTQDDFRQRPTRRLQPQRMSADAYRLMR